MQWQLLPNGEFGWKLGKCFRSSILIIHSLWAKHSPRRFRDSQFVSKLNQARLETCKSQRAPLIYSDPPRIKWLFREITVFFPRKVFIFFWPPSGSIFNGPHKTVGRVPPRLSRDNWPFTTNPRSKSRIVLFSSRIDQIWAAESSVCYRLSDSRERTMIILAIPGRISRS
jgi:hypothetical protein